MGLAVYNNIILDIHFPLCCYKKLLVPLPMSTSRTTLCLTEMFPDHSHDHPVGMASLHLSDLIQVMPVSILSRTVKGMKYTHTHTHTHVCANNTQSHTHTRTHTLQTIGRSLQQLKNYEGDVEELCFTFQVQ